MAKTKTVRMTRAQPDAVAVANVPAADVAAWKAAGWVADEPAPKAATEAADD